MILMSILYWVSILISIVSNSLSLTITITYIASDVIATPHVIEITEAAGRLSQIG
jgi:hypothetical protein